MKWLWIGKEYKRNKDWRDNIVKNTDISKKKKVKCG